MGYPTITQTWTISANNRYTPFVSLTAAMGSLMFSLSTFLITTMGYTCKGSCDGTTGAMDGVNRITGVTKFTTRFNGAAGAQSWIVVTDGQGVDWCISYNSSLDDVARLAFSLGGNYVAAGTPAQQPTATDEAFNSQSGSWINATASADRVWNMWGSADKKMWRVNVFRSSVSISLLGGEKLTSFLISPATHSLANGGGTSAVCQHGYFTLNPSDFWTGQEYLATDRGSTGRVHCGGQDVNANTSVCGEMIEGVGASGVMAGASPGLQGGNGHLIFPANLGRRSDANADGKLGNTIDWWFAWTSTPTTVPGPGDTYNSLGFIALGNTAILPWDGATTPVIT